MTHKVLNLKDYFPQLQGGVLTLYLPYNMSEMRKEKQLRPTILILPGGAYRFCSQRESEVIALHFLTDFVRVLYLQLNFPAYLY